MKPLLIVALWAYAGWDVGAWAEALAGIPAVFGIIGGIAIGGGLAVEARRRIAARVPQLTALSSVEPTPALDRAA